MNDASRALLDWILQNIDSLRLSVQVNNWNSLMGQDYHDCKTTIQVNNKMYEGRGTSASEEVAFLKGFCEAVDRATFVASGAQGSTNGLAVHPDPSLASEYARCELIERDKFFSHYLTKTPFFEPQHTLEDAGFGHGNLQFLIQNGIRFKLAEMRRSVDVCSYIFMAHGLNAPVPLGFMFGMGCRTNPVDAIRSAVIEGLRHIISNLNNTELSSISEREFDSLEFWTPTTHLRLANNIQYTEKIIAWMFELEHSDMNSSELPILDKIPVQSLALPVGLQAPVAVRKAVQIDLTQDLFFGPVNKKNVNLKRLSDFSGREIKWEQINQIPHPMG